MYNRIKGVITLSIREKCMELISTVPDYKIGYVLAYLQGLTADEAEDDAFCEKLYQSYEADPDKGEYISLEELASDLGVAL